MFVRSSWPQTHTHTHTLLQVIHDRLGKVALHNELLECSEKEEEEEELRFFFLLSSIVAANWIECNYFFFLFHIVIVDVGAMDFSDLPFCLASSWHCESSFNARLNRKQMTFTLNVVIHHDKNMNSISIQLDFSIAMRINSCWLFAYKCEWTLARMDLFVGFHASSK